MTTGTTLVLGGTGKTGRRIAQRRREQGKAIRIGSRSADPPFDWNDPATWPAALRGVHAAYIAYYPDLAVPDAADAIRSFTRLAVGSGVTRLVLLSGRGEPEAERCEQLVRESGARWTLLRCAWFAQNFSENYLLDPLLAGELALPVGNVGEPFVDADDIADVAVAALTAPGHDGQLYELTGPRPWTFPQAVREIAGATGRTIRYVEVSADGYAADLARQDVPPEVIALLGYLFTEVLDGRNARTADGVERALGRPPRDFTEYVRDTAAAGAWNPRPAQPSAARARRATRLDAGVTK
jgi:uncharacterized protein YbjT (DUF2867 family)